MDNTIRPDGPDRSDPQATNETAVMAAVCSLGSIGIFLIAILSLFGSRSDTFGPAFLFFCGLSILANILGVILGFSALFQIRKDPGLKGRGWATSAIVIGMVSILIYYYIATGGM